MNLTVDPISGNTRGNRKISWKRIIVLFMASAIIGLNVYRDYLNMKIDFYNAMNLLLKTRFESATQGKQLIVKFEDNKLNVVDSITGKLISSLDTPTLYKVEYDTVIGDRTIVFDTGTTSRHNKKIHGGEVTFKSMLGFKRYIHVNCAGLIREGRYPDE